MKKYKLEQINDLKKNEDLNEFENEIKLIPGQGSGISLRYFYMLAGETDLIKPDRMIMRFLEENIGQKVSIDESQKLLRKVCAKINEKGYLINAKKLDNLIWNYQRQF